MKKFKRVVAVLTAVIITLSTLSVATFASDSAANNISYGYCAESISISKPDCTLYSGMNMTYQMDVSFLPEGSFAEAVTYSSSDPEIATVNSSGLVTIHSKTGTVEITAVTASGLNDSVVLSVLPVSALEVNQEYILSFESENDTQYYRFTTGDAGIYNFNYETDAVATVMYTVNGNLVYADIPAGDFSANLPADTVFELRLKSNSAVDEEILTIVPPFSDEEEEPEQPDTPKRLTSDDVESVEFEPITMFENTYGHWLSYYNEDTGEQEKYYCYDWSPFLSYTITLKNGDVIEAPDGYFTYDGIYYAGSYAHAHIDYNQRWLVNNSYTDKHTILGKEYDVPITIAKSPVKSIRCDVDEIVLLEGSYCDIITSSTSSVPIYQYRWYEAANWIVEFQNGDEVTAFNGIVEIDDHNYAFDFSDTQGTLQSWTVGNTYTAHAKFMGLEHDVDVTITDSFIKDISFKDIYVYENADGNYNTEYDFDTNSYTEWFKYNWQQFVDFDVTFVPGVQVDIYGNFGFYYNGEYYGIEMPDTQTFYSQWRAGSTYDIELGLFGKKYAIKVEVLPSPVKKVTFESIVIDQGYGSTETEYDALLNKNFTYFKYNDHDFNFSVSFNDETTLDGLTGSFEYDGRSYSPMIVGGMQTHNNIWEPGHAYQITVKVMGVDTVVPVYIKPIDAAEGFGYFYNYRGDISITECNSMDPRLTIPAEIGEHVVTEIFSLDIANDYVEELVLPATIKELGRFDFTSMPNLKTIYFSGSEYEWDYISHFYSGYGNIEIVYNYSQTPPAAVMPICQSVGINSVILTAIEGYEYSIDGINWQRSNVFTNLSFATEYTFYQRIAATDGCPAGAPSPCLIVKTKCPHTYDNACDKYCNICNEKRTVTHKFTAATCTKAKTCTICGAISGSKLSHAYSGVCDPTCNMCGAKRTAAVHKYTNNADTSCNVCGAFAYPGGSTLYKVNGKLYHVVNRKIVKDTTLVLYGGKYFYVKNGVYTKATTLVNYGGSYRYVKNGVYTKATTLVLYGGKYLYVKNGVYTKATTLVLYGGKYLYVKNGVYTKATTLVKYGGKWLYVKNGVYTKATTLVKYGVKYYYVKNGVMNPAFSGKVKIGAKTYTIKKGSVA